MTMVGPPGGQLLQSGLVPRGTRVEVFRQIFEVFLLLGTLVGVVVVGYTLYNAYKYRASADRGTDEDLPTLGELPTGGGGGRKLFVSFGLSAVVVLSLIGWTYGTLLFVEAGPADVDERPVDEALTVQVVGFQFGWEFQYPNGYVEQGTLHVPEDADVRLRVTSRDVFHNFGIPDQRVKSDAIPGQNTTTWFVADEPGTYTARCYELCGAAHSHMTADVVVMPKEEFRAWYDEAGASDGSANASVAADPAPARVTATATATGVSPA
jgi:cytochrome c oxidase subunit 2